MLGCRFCLCSIKNHALNDENFKKKKGAAILQRGTACKLPILAPNLPPLSLRTPCGVLASSISTSQMISTAINSNKTISSGALALGTQPVVGARCCKTSASGPKMVPKRSQNGPKVVPKRSQSPEWLWEKQDPGLWGTQQGTTRCAAFFRGWKLQKKSIPSTEAAPEWG